MAPRCWYYQVHMSSWETMDRWGAKHLDMVFRPSISGHIIYRCTSPNTIHTLVYFFAYYGRASPFECEDHVTLLTCTVKHTCVFQELREELIRGLWVRVELCEMSTSVGGSQSPIMLTLTVSTHLSPSYLKEQHRLYSIISAFPPSPSPLSGQNIAVRRKESRYSNNHVFIGTRKELWIPRQTTKGKKRRQKDTRLEALHLK